MAGTKWIIESRYGFSDGRPGGLKMDGPQPEEVFGDAAITGMTEDYMAKVIFRHVPDAILEGGSIAAWPAVINPFWSARRKTW